MSEMKITVELKASEIAEAISNLAEAISGRTVVATEKIIFDMAAKKKDAVEQVENKKEESDMVQPDQEPEENDEPITIEQVREAFMNKNSKANTSKLKAILKKYNVAKVTDLPEESFADVLKELEEI